MIRIAYYDSPIGRVAVEAGEREVTAVYFADSPRGEEARPASADHPVLKQAVMQLDEYFRGARREFTLPVARQGTDFQRTVWNEVRSIPYGETRSYRDIAAASGHRRAVRAVGAANARNRLLLVIPCHRVTGSDGRLTGYAGGLPRKEWLLRHERPHDDG